MDLPAFSPLLVPRTEDCKHGFDKSLMTLPLYRRPVQKVPHPQKARNGLRYTEAKDKGH